MTFSSRGISTSELSLNALSVQEQLGSSERVLALVHALLFVAAAAKSNVVYNASNAVMSDVRSLPSFDALIHLRNAPTQLMKELNNGKDYRYARNETDDYAVRETYLPSELNGKRYYWPTGRGLEQKIREKLEYFNSLKDTSAIKKDKDT